MGIARPFHVVFDVRDLNLSNIITRCSLSVTHAFWFHLRVEPLCRVTNILNLSLLFVVLVIYRSQNAFLSIFLLMHRSDYLNK